MRYETTNEKIPVAPMAMPRPATVQDYREHAGIRNARKIILIVLSIQLVFAAFYFIQQLVDMVRYFRLPETKRDNTHSASYIVNVVASAISVVYLSLFIVVVHQYRRLAILIFSGLSLIQLICTGVVVISSVISVIADASASRNFGGGIVAGVSVIILAAISCVLTILVVVFGLKMARLLKQQEAYQLV